MAELSETYINYMSGKLSWYVLTLGALSATIQVKARMQTLQGLCFLYWVLLEIKTGVYIFYYWWLCSQKAKLDSWQTWTKKAVEANIISDLMVSLLVQGLVALRIDKVTSFLHANISHCQCFVWVCNNSTNHCRVYLSKSRSSTVLINS